MKFQCPRGLFLTLLAGTSALRAAAPVVVSVHADSNVVGQLTTLYSIVSDADANLSSVAYSVSGPGITGWQNVGSVVVSGGLSTNQISWTPTTAGLFTVQVTVTDATAGTASATAFAPNPREGLQS
jgi:hypothetical protein